MTSSSARFEHDVDLASTWNHTPDLREMHDLVEDIRQGKMVIIVDDEDRENEGDLVMAASWVRPEDVNFMARFGRGLICLTLTRERCKQLNLPLMVGRTDSAHGTNFTVSIEAAVGVTTGISAADRACTIRAAVAPHAQPDDLNQPGHVFPLMAQPGGVLARAGHTEAGCDLARLAGLEPAAVIVEILNEDGTMARRPQLEEFARTHRLRIGTIADLIRYRIAHEKTISRAASCELETEWGPFQLIAYQEAHTTNVHFALVRGPLQHDEPTLVRVHLQDSAADILGLSRDDVTWSLRRALERVAQEGRGVIVILRRPEDPQELLQRIRDHAMVDRGVSLPKLAPGSELRTYGVGAQIVSDLGVRRMRVIGTPKRFHGLAGFGLEIVDYLDSHECKK